MAMRSPFPGMDPWLEQHWGDVHARLITYACDRLQEQLPKSLRARLHKRVFFEAPSPAQVARVIQWGEPLQPERRVSNQKRTDAAQPLIIRLPVEEELEEKSETFIGIVEVGNGNEMVTVVDLLTPSNKRS